MIAVAFADGTRLGYIPRRIGDLHCATPNAGQERGAVKDEQLYAFVADARARNAADVRRRTRWLQHQLREDASFAELCRDLGSSGVPVELSLCDGRAHRGRLSGVGADVLGLQTMDGVTTYIAASAAVGIRAIAVEPAAGDGDASSETAVQEGQLFSDVLADLADLRVRVVAGTVPGRTYRGTLAGIGRDVVWFEDNQWYLRRDMITDVMVVP
jgi:hypothetical protein